MDKNNWYLSKTLTDPLSPSIQTLREQKICIMGAAGQVGSHIVTILYALGFPIKNIYLNDDLSLGKLENLPPLFRERVDNRSHLAFAQAPSCKPDIVIFVGGRSSAPHFNDLCDVMEELAAWQAVLEWCVSQNIRLIFASTSSLCKSRPSREEQKVWPGSFYELTKLGFEEMAIQQALCNDLSVQICRFFSVYGVTEQHKGNYGNLYTQLLWHARTGIPFEVWGKKGVFEPGEQTRDTVFAAEVGRAVLFLLSLPPSKPSLDDISALIYNIGQGEPVSVKEMIEHVSIVNGHKPSIVEKEIPPGVKNYVVHTWGEPQKLIQAGFKPVFTDHVENLRFINQALDNMDWYWTIIERIRRKHKKSTLQSSNRYPIHSSVSARPGRL